MRSIIHQSIACVVVALIFGVLVLVPKGLGQAMSATLLGTITDTSGAAVPAAKVTILATATEITHSGVTNGSGTTPFQTFSLEPTP